MQKPRLILLGRNKEGRRFLTLGDCRYEVLDHKPPSPIPRLLLRDKQKRKCEEVRVLFSEKEPLKHLVKAGATILHASRPLQHRSRELQGISTLY